LSKNEKVCSRILEIQNQTAQRTVTTIDDMIAQIDEDRRFARERGHSAAALAASLAKAKLMGFLAERPAVDLNFNYATMTEEELMFELAGLHAQVRAIKAGKQPSDRQLTWR
jgi:Ser-tRNA(Ala) deacylase AlaX